MIVIARIRTCVVGASGPIGGPSALRSPMAFGSTRSMAFLSRPILV